MRRHFGPLPLNIIDQSSLKQQVPFGKQVVTDQILIGSHRHPVTNTEGTQDIQNLTEKEKDYVQHFFDYLLMCCTDIHTHSYELPHCVSLLNEPLLSQIICKFKCLYSTAIKEPSSQQSLRLPTATHDQQLLFTRMAFHAWHNLKSE